MKNNAAWVNRTSYDFDLVHLRQNDHLTHYAFFLTLSNVLFVKLNKC